LRFAPESRGAKLWFAFSDGSHTSEQEAGKFFVNTRSLSELRELTYRSPFDVNLQLALARAACEKFEELLKTDEDAGSECITAYGIAYFESDARSDIAQEAKVKYDVLTTVASLPGGDFDKAFSFFEKLYTNSSKPGVQHILNIRNDLETVCARIDADERGLQQVVAAQVATERYLQLAYDVVIGRKRVGRSAHESTLFNKAYYEDWENKMRSYGVELGDNPDFKHSEFVVVGAVPEPIDPAAIQVASGEDFGRFVLPDGRKVLPGLRYFETILASLGQQDVSKTMIAAPLAGQMVGAVSQEGPVEAYERFLRLREQGQWSEALDYLDADAQQTIASTMREALASAMIDKDKAQRLASMSDKDVVILAMKTGEIYATQIIGVDATGDHANLKTRIYSGGGLLTPTSRWRASTASGRRPIHTDQDHVSSSNYRI